MIKATVLSGSKTAAAELPCDKYDLYEMLQSIGIRESAKRILLTDNEGDDIRVRLCRVMRCIRACYVADDEG